MSIGPDSGNAGNNGGNGNSGGGATKYEKAGHGDNAFGGTGGDSNMVIPPPGDPLPASPDNVPDPVTTGGTGGNNSLAGDSTGLNGAPSMSVEQVTPDVHIRDKNQLFLENRGPENKLIPYDVTSNYPVESLKTWLSRAHLIRRNVAVSTLNASPIVLETNLIRTLSRGRVANFSWFSGDATITLRWNAPKTVFGTLLAYYQPGGVSVLNLTSSMNLARYKEIIDIQANQAVIHCPFIYARPYVNLLSNVAWGRLHIGTESLTAPRSATDTTWTPTLSVYVSFTNISLLTPTPFAQPEGLVASKAIAVGTATAARRAKRRGRSKTNNSRTHLPDQYPESDDDDYMDDTPMYQPAGQDVVRTFAEAINLCRADGMDPSVPMGREAKELSPKGHKHGVYSMREYASTPFYVHLPALSNNTRLDFNVGRVSCFHRLYAAVGALRADFRVTLHCFATAFHSGRVRIVYSPTTVASAVGIPDGIERSWAPSIIWNIEENKTITFDVPYGSPTEYDRMPMIYIVPEVPFISSFGISTPVFLATVVPFNIRTVGFGTRSPLFVRNSALDAQDISPSNVLVEAQSTSFNTPGWYNPVHTSEDSTNDCLKTLFRRPGPIQGETVTGLAAFLPQAMRLRLITASAWLRFDLFGGAIINQFIGWRGTVKISLVGSSDMTFTARMNYGRYSTQPTTENTSGLIRSNNAFLEVSIPYFSRNLFNVAMTTIAIMEGPFLYIEPSSLTTPYEVFISFMDDFELIGMGAPSGIPPNPTMDIQEAIEDNDSESNIAGSRDGNLEEVAA